jgi:hypothetical protein
MKAHVPFKGDQIGIDGSGTASAPVDFTVTGSVTPTLAFATSFGFAIDAIAVVNDERSRSWEPFPSHRLSS